jgi:hypothetical protein
VVQEEYIKNLKLIGSLSQLFSTSSKPFLYYRIAEFLYIKAFSAKDVSRSDIAVDAILGSTGIGLKTFQGHNGKSSFQKIAEFNKMRKELEATRTELGNLGFARHISALRNERIQLVADTFSEVSNFKYHCVVRDIGKFTIYEEPMDMIVIDDVRLTKETASSIHFTDGLHEYNFSISKSTLLKKFHETNPLYTFDVQILKNPLDELLSKFTNVITIPKVDIASIVLPLYSTQKRFERTVPTRSGLNQWNARGRQRDPNEVYIPIPAAVQRLFPGFIPSRTEPFKVWLPDGSSIPVKVSQDGAKALMSKPNNLLGDWLRVQVLKLQPEVLATRELLDRKGVDAVELTLLDGEYFLNLKKTGSYEKFIAENS